MKIGFVDYYLDNWHANQYPSFLREAISRFGFDARLEAAYAFTQKEDGLSTQAWCQRQNMRCAQSVEELLAGVDAVMVIAADDSRWHEQVCEKPLRSGKPVFVDKTFASDLGAAKRMFALAKASQTPVFSSSAQRYCQSILDYLAAPHQTPRFMSTVGPHSLENYAVHQLEPMMAVMGAGVKRVKCFSCGPQVTQAILDYGDGRLGSFLQTPNPYAEFNFMVSDGEQGRRLESGECYINLMKAILDFFVHGILPVPSAQTLEIVALIDLIKKARRQPDRWFHLPNESEGACK